MTDKLAEICATKRLEVTARKLWASLADLDAPLAAGVLLSIVGVGLALGVRPPTMGGAGFVDCPYCDRRFIAATAPGDEDERLAPGVYEGSAGH